MHKKGSKVNDLRIYFDRDSFVVIKDKCII